MTTELLLIRHAETDLNRQLRFQGHIDVPLNATGQAQAERLARRLADEPIDRLVVSDLQRARETAAPLARLHGLALAPDRRWREQAFGVLEGLNGADIRARHPTLWDAWTRHEADHAPPGGESNRAFHDRVWSGLAELVAAYPDERIVLVTHGGVLDMVWRGLHGLGPSGARSCEIPNTGLNRLRHTSAGAGQGPVPMELLLWGDAAHLADMAEAPVSYPTAPLRPA